MLLLGKLREAGMLQVVMEARGQRPQVLALAELVNLCDLKGRTATLKEISATD